MPGTRKGKPAKDKPKDKIFSQLLANAGLWADTNRLVKEVCRKLRIPDCDTTRGLKKCHESFETVHAALDKVYAQSRECSGDRLAADHLAVAILLIYSQMGADSFLRKRICFETGFLDKAVDLLASPFVRENVSFTLSKMSHQKDAAVLQAISHFTSAILDCAEPYLYELEFVETTVCILSHAVIGTLEAETLDPNVVDALPRVLRFMINVVRLPASTPLSFSHLVLFCYAVLPLYPEIALANPDSIDFLVVCARSPELCDRIRSQRALIEVCDELADSPENVRQVGPTSRDAFVSLQAYYRDTEPFVSKLMKDVNQLTTLANGYKTNPNCSHSKLGQVLAALSLRNMTNVGTWMQRFEKGAEEMFRVCEAACRNAADETNKLDIIADILHIQILVANEHTCKASHYAAEAVQRHPSVPLFFYILANLRCGASCSGDDSISRVLHAEKGLQCVDGMTDYIRQQLLYLSVSQSHLVVARLTRGLDSDSRMAEVDALISAAFDNANTFTRVAPLDHNYVPLMTAFATHLDLLKNGHIWTDDTFKTTRKSFTRTCDIARCTTGGFIPTKECYALDKILDRMSSAWKTWGSIVSRQPVKSSTISVSTATDVDSSSDDVDIIAWFEKLYTASCDSRAFAMHVHGMTPGTQSYRYGEAELYPCSYCNIISATLKKCAGCQKTRYCNNICQKAHWKAHREECKATRIDAEI